MNTIMRNTASTTYYLISIWKEQNEYTIKTKWISFENQVVALLKAGTFERFKSLKEAKRRCRALVKNKESHRGLIEIGLNTLPQSVIAYLAPPIDSQMTSEEFLHFVTRIRMERYVTVGDNSGMESYFDAGIQYVGYVTDDPYLYEVYDKYGNIRNLSTTRLTCVEKTEDCIQAEKVGKNL